MPPSDPAATRVRLGLRVEAFYAGFMGRTAAELPWCFDALAATFPAHPRLRLAVCGAPASCLEGLPDAVRSRVDYLGQLAPDDAGAFAGCLDLGLIPLGHSEFNRARLPQKFGDHLAARVPVLCSNVGECARLIDRFPWALPAGSTRDEWVVAFRRTVDRLAAGDVPPYDPFVFQEHLSWDGLSCRLARAYRLALGQGRPPAGRRKPR
jgi:hypothetical protein